MRESGRYRSDTYYVPGSTMVIWVGSREETLGDSRCCTRVLLLGAAWCFCCCCYCCGWCWCEVTWSVPQHRLDGRTAPLHDCATCCTMDWWEEATSRRVSPCGAGPGREGRRKGASSRPGRAGPPLAAAHSRPDASFPPPPHSATSDFDSVPYTTADYSWSLLTFLSQSVFPSPRYRRFPSISCRQIAAKPQCDVPMLREDMPDRCLSTEASTEEFFHSALAEALVLEHTRRSFPSRVQWIQGQS